jgi:HupE/UreJ protein
VHGLGFAGALEDLQLRLSELPLTLFSFNLGVELGQLAVSAFALPLLMKLHATERGLRAVRLSCVVLSATGFFWFLERVGVVSEGNRDVRYERTSTMPSQRGRPKNAARRVRSSETIIRRA